MKLFMIETWQPDVTLLGTSSMLYGPKLQDHYRPDTDPQLNGIHRGPKILPRACDGPVLPSK